MDYVVNGVFGGDIALVLSPGLKLTVPNHQLVAPEVERFW
jgi:hypothetical protein